MEQCKSRRFFNGRKCKYALYLMLLLFSSSLIADNKNIPYNSVDNLNANSGEQDIKNSGPVQLSYNVDSLLGFIGDAKVLLNLNDSKATALELAAGPRAFRGNGTYGWTLNDKNRLKLTAEYLREDFDFDFMSGESRQWVGQGAVGAAYQYWLGGNILKNLQVGGHYSHAGSKDLSSQIINLGDGVSLLDERRIAGGTDWNGTAEAAASLWAHSLLTMGADYDRVRYDTHYNIHENADAQGMGGHIRLQQLLTSTKQLELQSSVTQLASSYGATFNWALMSHAATRWVVGLSSTYTTDHTTERHFFVSGVTLNITVDNPRAQKLELAYRDPDVSAQDLLVWTAIPAVYMPDVLTVTDERITNTDPSNSVQSFQSVTGACPDATQITYDQNTGSYKSANGWSQSYLSPGIPSPESWTPIFDSANIMANPGAAECLYRLRLNDALVLTNSTYQLVESDSGNWGQSVSVLWPSGLGTPVATCAGDPTNCTFKTVAASPKPVLKK